MSVAIREERAADVARVQRVVRAAFGRDEEARLVERLRECARPRLSLVAESDGELAGHVFFSPVTLDPAPRPAPAVAGLAPLAVVPERQGRGIGAALVRAGLARCPSLGWSAVVLLGDPAYYARFGFAPAAAQGLFYRSEAFAPAFQVLELEPGALAGCRGELHYHPAFAGTGTG